MIISASRRTDIPAFYADWFLNRIRHGYCTVPNPFNGRQVSRISLKPEDVDVIVFWTRNPQPIIQYLAELDARGYRYYFQYTLMNNPRSIDPMAPSRDISLRSFRNLSDRIGPEKVIWRYDPILFSGVTGPEFHKEEFGKIGRTLKHATRRSIISIVDIYKKNTKRLQEILGPANDHESSIQKAIADLIPAIADVAHENGMEMFSCAEDIDLTAYGVHPGKCVDDGYIKEIFGIDVHHQKDPSQRKACGCVVSRDIGMYDSCIFGCRYCYATSNFERAKMNHRDHNPHSPSLIGRHEAISQEESNRPLKL